MASFAINSSVTATGTVLDMGTSGYSRIGRDGSVISSTDIAIEGSGSTHLVTVDGEVIGLIGVSLGSSGAADGHSITIGRSGSVKGISAIELIGYENELVNLGLIQGSVVFAANALVGGLRPASRVFNGGDLLGTLRAQGGNPLDLHNTGLIDARPFDNPYAVSSTSDEVDTVLNDGVIHGDISLDGGNDSYNGIKGKLFGRVLGGDGNDDLYGGAGADQLLGQNGNDVFNGGAGDDYLEGGDGLDWIIGGAGADILDGGAGNDQMDGGTGADSLYGGAGDDTYTVDNKGDIIVDVGAGDGIDQVLASVSYTLGADARVEVFTYTGKVNGTLVGNKFDQKLIGNTGSDKLDGKAGNDTLDGYIGQDTLTGGAGKDIFLFRELATVPKVDTITDFKVVDDIIHLENAVFKALAAGALAGPAFAKNLTGKPVDASDRVIYETDTGKLFYDPDGTGAAKTVQFAFLSKNLALTAGDFLVI